MKNLIHNALFSMGYSVIPHTDYADVRSLISSLKPQDCGRDLIRIGGSGDGGYLIPDDLEGIEYCFSPGVSSVANFEDHLADLDIKSFMADYSVDSPPIHRPEFIFDKKFLGSTESDRFLTLPSWKQRYLGDYSGDLLLQMDIEGSEYEVILNTPDELLDQFRIIVIEFHQLHRLFEPFAYKLFDSCFRKLSKHFHVAHIHPNNSLLSIRRGDIEIPRILEFTFYNKKRAPHSKDAGVFPHPLDEDCDPKNKSLHLPRCWYSTA